MIKLYEQWKDNLKDKKCIQCNQRPIYIYKKQLCKQCYNHTYITKKRTAMGYTTCRCGCGETIPVLTATSTIAQFKHGHCLKYTENNEKRIRSCGNGFVYLKNNESFDDTHI